MIHHRLALCLILTLGAFAEEPRVRLHYEKAELGAVLRDLAGLWHKPVLIAPGVKGSFTGDFEGMQVQEAIRQVVRVSPAALDGKLVCGTLVVAPAGFPLTVEEIRVVGNQRTTAETVMRNMRTKVGDTILPSRLIKDMERLQNIGFFKTVELGLRAGKQSDQVVVELQVVEQASGLATIGIGCMKPWRPNWLTSLREFGVEVDSASYGYLRDFLKPGHLPPARAVRQAQPNPAHYALTRLQKESGCDVRLITQNVDGLHQRAGFENVVELHGSLLRSRCSHCDLEPFEDPEGEARPCPACGHLLRPDIVLFGERIPEQADLAAFGAVLRCDVFLAVGTSGSVAPASNLVCRADMYGATTLIVNLEPLNPPNPAFHHQVLGKAEEILPGLFSW